MADKPRAEAEEILHSAKTAAGTEQQRTPLHLDQFIPYKLSVLSNVISRSVAQIYATRFDLTIPEWRVMAVIGLEESKDHSISANFVAVRTAMDKVQVSRAVSRMIDNGLLSRTIDKDDRRRSVLKLTDTGRRVYEEIVPAALAYERQLLGNLSPEEFIALEKLIGKLTDAALTLDTGEA